jgi:tetratricopeptide (TPR) repeat protein
MSEPSDSSTPRKRRVIHWDPDHGKANGGRRWTALRIAGWIVGGGLAALIVAGLVIRGIRLVVGPQFLRPAAVAAPGAETDPSLAFVSESKATLARETVAKSLTELRRLPQDHPSQLQQLILIEKAFLGGDELLAAGKYSAAYAHFSALGRELDAYGENVKLKQSTQKAYDEVLARMRELDRARPLAPEEFETAFASAGAGRQFFVDGSFATAKRQFDDAFAALDRAEQALKDYVDGNIRQALAAVAAGEKPTALAAFQAALEKDPGNEMAQQGLKRAEVADRVRALVLQGESYEQKKEHALAAEAYAKAFELDAFSAVAQQGKSRNERLRRETELNAALAEAVAHRETGTWDKAIAAYERALKVNPQDETVKKALAETRETAHREAVKTALTKALAYENKYEWEQARGAYYETMELDAEHTEAKDGYFRTGKMIRTLMQYNKLVDVAEAHAQRAEFQHAIRNFNEAMAIKPAYLALTDRVSQLRALLNQQSKPVDVTFNSDGNCWVSISNYRMLGKITAQTVKMLPGDYEIVSRRKGYQDVLLLLQVRNGSTPPVVNVACTLRANR